MHWAEASCWPSFDSSCWTLWINPDSRLFTGCLISSFSDLRWIETNSSDEIISCLDQCTSYPVTQEGWMLTIILKQPLGLDLSLGRELNWAWRCCRPRDSTLSFLPKGTGPCQILNGHLLPPSTFLLSQTQVSASLHGWHFTLQSRRLNQFSSVNRTQLYLSLRLLGIKY